MRQPKRAVVILGSMNTVTHSEKLRLVAMITPGALAEIGEQVKEQGASGLAEGKLA